ncbi:MAG: glycosyltransferase family 2 protein [archaeon]|nr:glycosyltransferase family 2 protein [archaeon]
MSMDIVVPCYNEEKVLTQFFEEVNYQMKDYEWKIIFVDDGSQDNTLNIIKKLSNEFTNIKYLSFSRNFGKEAAIYAGLQYSTGDYVILMDADMQDPPYLIPQMIDEIKKGNDIVATRRVTRKGEPFLRSFGARTFYKLINKFSDVEIVDGARDYRIMKREVVDSVLDLKEYNRFSKGIFQWVGYKTKWIEYENVARKEGESSWSFWELVKYSIEGLVSFTTAPLHIATIFGFIFSVIAFIALLYIVIRTMIFGNPVDGWPSLASIILFIGGIQLLTIGILGQYLSKIYLESKRRPVYIIREND